MKRYFQCQPKHGIFAQVGKVRKTTATSTIIPKPILKFQPNKPKLPLPTKTTTTTHTKDLSFNSSFPPAATSPHHQHIPTPTNESNPFLTNHSSAITNGHRSNESSHKLTNGHTTNGHNNNDVDEALRAMEVRRII